MVGTVVVPVLVALVVFGVVDIVAAIVVLVPVHAISWLLLCLSLLLV